MNINMLRNLGAIISITIMGLNIINSQISNRLLDSKIEEKVHESLQKNYHQR